MKAVAIATMLAASLQVLPADAQSTSSAYAEPIFIDGELKGCTLVFDVDFLDTRYRAGEQSHAAGSVTLLETDGSVVIGLKLGLTSSVRDTAVEAPASAFLVSGTRTNAADLISSFESDLPGFRNFAFEPGEVSSAAVGDLMAGEGRVGFTRSGGSVAQLFDVAVDDEQAGIFRECAGQLLEDLQRSSGG